MGRKQKLTNTKAKIYCLTQNEKLIRVREVNYFKDLQNRIFYLWNVWIQRDFFYWLTQLISKRKLVFQSWQSFPKIITNEKHVLTRLNELYHVLIEIKWLSNCTQFFLKWIHFVCTHTHNQPHLYLVYLNTANWKRTYQAIAYSSAIMLSDFPMRNLFISSRMY